MAFAIATKGLVWEGATAVFLARVQAADGALITQSSVSSIAVRVFNKTPSSSKTPTLNTTANVATTIFNTLQLDSRWTADSLGFNFEFKTPPSAFPIGGRIYMIEILITATNGDILPVVFEVQAGNLFTS